MEEDKKQIIKGIKKSEEKNSQELGLADIMELIEKGLTPPGIEVYNDMPTESNMEATKSILTKTTKVN